jgi:hypothetical protein
MRYPWKKGAAIGFLVFLALWVVGIIRGWSLPYPEPVAPNLSLVDPLNAYNPSQLSQVANNLKQIGLALWSLPFVLEKVDVDRIRVHEKSAQLTSGTTEFDTDETRIRAALEEHEASVFNERKAGITPGRRLILEIGVPPEKFDALVEQLREIAHLESVSVQQRDRTGDFRRLHAQRESLKTYFDSVKKLRGTKEASVEDTLKLEQRIQEIEKELQSLSVQLGDLLGKESFYQVHATLYEYQPGSRLDRTYNLPRRIYRAFLWAVMTWLTGALGLGLLAGAVASVRTLWPGKTMTAAT